MTFGKKNHIMQKTTLLISMALDICLSTELLDNLVSNANYQPYFC